MSTLRHVMILASAGSGKTYALTNRFVELLAAGAAPERIVALTFTRKAAGEFFDEILGKLARAARDPSYARTLADQIARPGLGSGDFSRMLRAVVDAMHRLRLGTLDGFFARIAHTFPLELGITGEFELLEEQAAQSERRRVLQRMFARSGALSPAQQEFIEAFKRATLGAEEKRLGACLERYLDQHQDVYLAAPHSQAWGDSARIWPNTAQWFSAIGPLNEVAAELRRALLKCALTPAQQDRWDGFLSALPEFLPGAPLPGPVGYILKNALAVWPALLSGKADMIVERRKFPIDAEMAAPLCALVRHIVGAELKACLTTTRGIHAILNGYEGLYHGTVRRAGKLTFSDVQRLLLPGNGVPVLGQGETDFEGAESRLGIDYRVDGAIDHWLFDEFQDTSHAQWQVLRNLVDEAIQDPTGARSFFCVGDVKQAIYSWRGGDHRLFRQILQHYNRSSHATIEEKTLDESRRSGPAIIGMVNAVFGNAAVLADLFPSEAAATWSREWRDHTSALPQRGGHAALLHADDESDRWAKLKGLLEEIRPLNRGLSCAVLVLKNETARTLANFIRGEVGMPATAESDLRIAADNPLGSAMLALIRAAAHPSDTLAWEHVQMSPLAISLAGFGLSTPEKVSVSVLQQVHAHGFEGTIEFWLRQLEAHLEPDDAFSRERGRQIAAAAAIFDETGSRNIAEFGEFMTDYKLRDSESTSVIRVMTVHKAKGLGFDVVILPDLEGQKLGQARDGLAVGKAADRSIDWVLDLPAKLFCEPDDVLSAHLRGAEAEACYEKFALLYVAMTRAKYAMYAIIEAVGTSRSHNYARWLSEALGSEVGPIPVGGLNLFGSWSRGDPHWHVVIAANPDQQGEHPAGGSLGRVDHASHPPVRPMARRPSGEKRGKLAGKKLFGLLGNRAAEFGTRVHELLAQVQWLDAFDGKFPVVLKEKGKEDAVREALSCLHAPSLSSVWTRPIDAPRCEVWRERSFEVVVCGAWVTGSFDRVIVKFNDSGQASSAAVFDFKTDHVSDHDDVNEVAFRYAGQLELYREVAAVMWGLDRENVAVSVVLTKSCRIVNVVDV